MEQLFQCQTVSVIPFKIIGIPVAVVPSTSSYREANVASQLCLPSTPTYSPPVDRFQNDSDFTRWVLAIHEAEHGTYYVPPQTFRGDAFGYFHD